MNNKWNKSCPEKNGDYLVQEKGEETDIYIANFFNGTWHDMDEDVTEFIRYWMYLPERKI